MNLSRLVLNPLSRDVARAITDVQRMHQLVMSSFDSALGGEGRARHSVLYRLETDPQAGALVLYVQSASSPDWSRLPEGVLVSLDDDANPRTRALSEIDLVAAGKTAHFRLRANATRKIATKSQDGHRQNGQRVPLRDDERCIQWLLRKAQNHGFEILRDAQGLLNLKLTREPLERGRRSGATITFEGVRFDGCLQIINADAFRSAVVHGIGPGKAYGFGFLSFAPLESR